MAVRVAAMTTGTITTTVTFDGLIQSYDEELETLREAHEEVQALIEDDTEDLSTEEQTMLGQQVQLLNESAKQIQKRQHVLERLAEQFGDGAFELKMLTGQEIMDIETGLRMAANRQDVDPDALQARRKQQVVDAGTVAAPDGVPHEDGSPVPSQCPNPLTFALYEQVEALNNAGTTDFRAPGFESEGGSPASALSEPPTPSAMPSSVPLDTDGLSPASGDDSATKPTPD